MTDERTVGRPARRRPALDGWVVATCAALILAAAGDAGPEIVASRSLVSGDDGPGSLICLGSPRSSRWCGGGSCRCWQW